MKIVILASVWCQNLGDELILKNTIKYFELKYSSKKLQFEVFSYDQSNPFCTQKNLNYWSYFPNNIRSFTWFWKNIGYYLQFYKILRSADLVVIWGGGLFFDNEDSVSTLKNLNIWESRIQKLKRYKKKLHIYAVWINFEDTKNDIHNAKIQSIFWYADEISVRDNFSQKYLKSLWISSKLVDDPVYFDNWTYLEDQALHLSRFPITGFSIKALQALELKEKNIWIAVRRLNIPWYEQQLLELIEYLIQKKAKITILPHSFHKHDIASNDYSFFKNLLEKNYDTTDTLKKIRIAKSLKETYRYYTQAQLDIVFASRLHSLILCRVYKIPYVSLSYSRKTDEQL